MRAGRPIRLQAKAGPVLEVFQVDTLGVALTTAQRYFASLRSAALEAGSRSGWMDRSLEVGARTLRLRFAGDALLPVLFPPLQHLVSDGASSPDLTILLWDSKSTGVPLPAPPWQKEDVLERGLVRGYNDARVRALYHLGFGGLTMYDVESRTLVFWVADGKRIEWHDRAAPLRTCLNWALGGERHGLVHAAAVGGVGGGVLIGGPSGSGKTSLALACVGQGLAYLGDDYVVLSTRHSPTAFSLYSTAKVRPDCVELMPQLSEKLAAACFEHEKAVLDLRGNTRREAVVRAVVLPRLGASRLRLKGATPSAALRAFGPSTAFQMPHDPREIAERLDNLGQLLRQTPVYELHLTSDVNAGARAVMGLLDRAAGE